jgi:ribonuclease VapC
LTVVVDTSAILAILNEEAEATTFARLLRAASGSSLISAGNAIEANRVMLSRAGGRSARQLDRLLHHFDIEIAPVDAAQVAFARDGMERFGKGRGTAPAALNFGDLFAYALARARTAPLLFKGDDFTQTDLIPAWTP